MSASDVTVVVPVYDRRQELQRALASVLAQSRRPAAIVVVDDGSSDGSGVVARRLGADVIRQDNAGSSAARNRGLASAGTSWVAFLDSDDEWHADHLATLVDAADARGGVLLSTGARTDSGQLMGSLRSTPLRLSSEADLFWPWNPVVTSATMVDRAAALRVGGFDPTRRHGEDLQLWKRLIDRGFGWSLPEITVDYHAHPGQVSADLAEMRRDLLSLLREERVARSVRRKVRSREEWHAFRSKMRSREVALADVLRACSRVYPPAIVDLMAHRRSALDRQAQYERTQEGPG
ncbi:glycosyltransferase family 2 protein [Geodermatophilus sp. SYSU D00867]